LDALNEQVARERKAEADRLLGAFYAARDDLWPLCDQGIFDALVAALPEGVDWAGITAASPVAWVAECVLRLDNSIRIDLSRHALQEADQAQLVSCWNEVRKALAGLVLPSEATVRAALERACAVAAEKEKDRKLLTALGPKIAAVDKEQAAI